MTAEQSAAILTVTRAVINSLDRFYCTCLGECHCLAQDIVEALNLLELNFPKEYSAAIQNP